MSNRQTLDDAVSAAAVNRDERRILPCARALELAARHEVPAREIGEACNRQGIRVANCQLGCFQ